MIDHFAHLAVLARLDTDLASTPGANPVERRGSMKFWPVSPPRTVRRPSAVLDHVIAHAGEATTAHVSLRSGERTRLALSGRLADPLPANTFTAVEALQYDGRRDELTGALGLILYSLREL